MGRPTYKEEQRIKDKIFSLLPKDGGEIQWSTLKEEASKLGMSPSTLSTHLKSLEHKVIKRRVDATKHPPGVFYSRIRISSSPIDKILLIPQNKLARLLESDTNIDELLNAVTVYVMGELTLSMPLILAYVLNIPTDIRIGDLPRERGTLNRSDAHDWLDTILDTDVRPLMHRLLNFYYLSDMDGKPLYQKDQMHKDYSAFGKAGRETILSSLFSIRKIAEKIERT
jgi:DNA-binding transcriptional ArsR family regulator